MEQPFKLTEGYRSWLNFVNQMRDVGESLQESKRVQRQVVLRCNQLKSELVSSANKLQTIMRVRAEDEKTMALLRKECDRAVRTSMEAQRKEKEAQKLVAGLQADIEGLQAQVGVLQSALWLERERGILAGAQTSISSTDGFKSSKVKPGSMTTTTTGTLPSKTGGSTAATADPASPDVTIPTTENGHKSAWHKQRRNDDKEHKAENAAVHKLGGAEKIQQRQALMKRVRYQDGSNSDRCHRKTATGVSNGSAKAVIDRGGRDKTTKHGRRGIARTGDLVAEKGHEARWGVDYRTVEHEFWDYGSASDEAEADGEYGGADHRHRKSRAVGGCSADARGKPTRLLRQGAWPGDEDVTPFQQWKREREIWYPGVAETTAGGSR